jgi:hypothetical protein
MNYNGCRNSVFIFLGPAFCAMYEATVLMNYGRDASSDLTSTHQTANSVPVNRRGSLLHPVFDNVRKNIITGSFAHPNRY